MLNNPVININKSLQMTYMKEQLKLNINSNKGSREHTVDGKLRLKNCRIKSDFYISQVFITKVRVIC